jgi:glycosyltransferase involved in cell wall biosynthesis
LSAERLDEKRSPRDVAANQQSLRDIRASLSHEYGAQVATAVYQQLFQGKESRGRPISSAEILVADGLAQQLVAGQNWLVGQSARFDPDLALRAFASFIQNSKLKIQNQAPPTLTLLGKGPDRERLETLAHSLGISEHIHFPGSVPQSEVARHFAEADVFLFTSVRDASGGVNLEAMASGLPILCIAHQGVGDITDDTCAIRIPPGTIEETIASLANSMQRMANDPNLRIELGANARRRALEKFSWEEKFERMLAIYQTAARGVANHQ